MGKQPAIESDCQREPDPEKVAPFPSALEKPALVEDNRTKKILEHLKDLKVNLPLVDAIQSIPSYSKFFKDLCTRKRNNSKVPQRVKLFEKVHSIFTSGLLPKLSDPGAFTLPCCIGKHKIDHALLDLGASVNLIPYSVYEQLGLGEMTPTFITLQLADRSERKPRGVVEDVMVQVGEFVYPVDFVVLDMNQGRDSRHQTQVLLGRPFLATADAVIKCRTGILKLKFGNLKTEMKVAEAANRIRTDGDESNCFMVDIIQDYVEDNLEDLMDDSDEIREFEHLLENFDVESFIEKFEPSTSEVEDVRPETTLAVDKISIEVVSNPDEGEVKVPPIEIFSTSRA